LPHDVLIEEAFYLWRLRELEVLWGRLIVGVFVDDVLAYPDTLVANEDRRTRDEFTNVILTLVAERASQDVVAIFLQGVPLYSFLPGVNRNPLSAETHV